MLQFSFQLVPNKVQMVRVLVTGGSGLLGRAIMKELAADPNCSVLGLAYSRAKDNLRKVDITQTDQLTQVIQEFKVIINTHVHV